MFGQETGRIDVGEVDTGQDQFAPCRARAPRGPDKEHAITRGDVEDPCARRCVSIAAAESGLSGTHAARRFSRQ